MFRYALLMMTLALNACSRDSARVQESTAATSQSALTKSADLSLAPGVSLTVTGARRSFGDNVEVFVTIANSTDTEYVASGLADVAALEATDDAAGKHRLHAASAGVSKPVVIGPRSSVTTSLLYGGFGSDISELAVAGGRSSRIQSRPVAEAAPPMPSALTKKPSKS
jgi:hypothetical protein